MLSMCWMTPGKVEDSIRIGGLAEVKTQRIKTILSTVKEERGAISMEYIRSMADDDIKAELTRWPAHVFAEKMSNCFVFFLRGGSAILHQLQFVGHPALQ